MVLTYLNNVKHKKYDYIIKRVDKMKRIIGILIIILLLLYAVYLFYTEYESFHMAYLTAIEKISLYQILFILGLSFLNYGMRALRWYHINRCYISKYSFSYAIKDYISAFAFILTPAKVGELYRSYILMQYHGLSFSKALAPSLFDRLYDVFIFLFFLILGIYYFPSYFWVAFPVAIIALLITVFLNSPMIFIPTLKKTYGCFKLGKKLTAKAMYFCRACRQSCSIDTIFWAMAYSFIGWGAEIYGFYYLAHLLDINISFYQASFIFSISTLSGVLFFITPGGIGGTEVTMIIILNLLGFSMPSSTMLTVLMRLVTFWFAIFIGWCVFLLPFPKARKKLIS